MFQDSVPAGSYNDPFLSSVWKLCVKESMWQSCVWKMVCVKVVCERERVTKLCVKESVCVEEIVRQSCVWKLVCGKVACERWRGERWCVCVWQSCVGKMVCVKVVWKRACNKVVCDRWCVWKLCVKERVWQSCVWKVVCDKVVCERWCVCDSCVWLSCVGKMVCWKMVCDKVMCERWCVTKLCAKDGVWKMVGNRKGVWQTGACKMVCDKAVCERWCVRDGVSKIACDKVLCERWCAKDGVWKMVCDKVVCDKVVCVRDRVSKMVGPSAPPEPAQCRNEGGCHQVPRLPHKTKVYATKCHPCHMKWRSCHQVPRLPRKAPRRHLQLIPVQAHHQSQPSAISATSATQSAGICRQVPGLPRETKVDVAKCHACHAKCRGVTGD